jgi:head-tail adaptor
VRFVIRYGNGAEVTSSMRIVHDSRTYNITEVIADPTLRDSFTLLAEGGIRG